MDSIKKIKTIYQEYSTIFRWRLDRWMMRNPIGLHNQKKLYNPIYKNISTLFLVLAGAYITANLGFFDISVPQQPQKKYFTQYYFLTNLLENQRLEQIGYKPHVQKMLERGLKRGLTQIELLQLAKLHEVDEPTRQMAHHIEYLRQLKS